jgi:cell division transport system permease protein
MSRHRGRSTVAALAMAFGLSLVALTLTASDNLSRWLHGWQHGTSAVIFLERDVSPTRVAQIQSALRSLEAVEWAEVVSPELALERLRDELGAEVMDGIDATALPASIELGFAPGIRDVALAHPVVERLMATDGIEDVELVGKWVDDVAVVADGLEIAAGAVTVVALVVCVFICFCAMAMRVGEDRSDERVYELLGARARLLRLPLLIEGLMLGLVAALIALLVAWLVLHLAGDSVMQIAAGLFGEVELQSISMARATAIMGLGVVSGLFGAFLATGSRARH